MMGILDYQIHLRKLSIFNITPLRTVVLRQLLPNRVFLYNSINYFIYHELSQLLDAEWEVFHHEKIANSLLGMALVHYKN